MEVYCMLLLLDKNLYYCLEKIFKLCNKLVYFNDVNSYVLKKYGFSFGVKYRRSINKGR